MFVLVLTVFLLCYSENEDNTSASRLDMAADHRKYLNNLLHSQAAATFVLVEVLLLPHPHPPEQYLHKFKHCVAPRTVAAWKMNQSLTHISGPHCGIDPFILLNYFSKHLTTN